MTTDLTDSVQRLREIDNTGTNWGVLLRYVEPRILSDVVAVVRAYLRVCDLPFRVCSQCRGFGLYGGDVCRACGGKRVVT